MAEMDDWAFRNNARLRFDRFWIKVSWYILGSRNMQESDMFQRVSRYTAGHCQRVDIATVEQLYIYLIKYMEDTVQHHVSCFSMSFYVKIGLRELLADRCPTMRLLTLNSLMSRLRKAALVLIWFDMYLSFFVNLLIELQYTIVYTY